jgi:hypothetical protein
MSRLAPRAPRRSAPTAARWIIERLARSDRVEVSATANDDEIEALRAIVEGTARNTGEVFFQTLVRHLATTVGVRIRRTFTYERKSSRSITSRRSSAVRRPSWPRSIRSVGWRRPTPRC